MKSSNIGGQAVMEGIMMRHKDKYAIAVRRPDKEIELKVEDYKCTFGKAAFLKWPIIRGVVSFVDGLVVGTKCLMYSAEIAGDEEDEKEAAKNATLTEEELSAKKAKEAKQFQWLLYITVAISIVVSVAAFMLLPYALASLLRKVGASEVGVTVAEAFVKLALFMGYMLLISRMKDIQRTFMYHGAEHTWTSTYCGKCPGKLQTAQKMWDKFPFSGNDCQYIPAFYFCAGTGLLGSPVWASSDGSNRVRCFF